MTTTAVGNVASYIRCDSCGVEWACIHPSSAKFNTLECPDCGACESQLVNIVVRLRQDEWCKFRAPAGGTFHRRGEDGRPLE